MGNTRNLNFMICKKIDFLCFCGMNDLPRELIGQKFAQNKDYEILSL